MSITRPGVLAAATLLLSGCASGGPSQPAPSAASGGIEVAVVNEHTRSVRVYLLDGPSAIPLGSVVSRQGRTFRIDPARLHSTGTLRLAVDPVGPAHRVELPPVDLVDGQSVEFTLTHGLQFTGIRIHQGRRGSRVIVRRWVS